MTNTSELVSCKLKPIQRLTGSGFRHHVMERKIPSPDKKTMEHMASLSWNDLMLFMHKKYGKKVTQDFTKNYMRRLQKLKWRKNQKWK
ncbi:MAG TPA: hypothetical protein VD699_01355 [Nitrosopumilaceae archaeon]|nr:hypothetical protein [Nitrosopumilaceae archaeon]HXV38209.1 hypothetical protein [Nitrosopumilaceae archaeon]